jgi:hypothetical protein
MKIPLVLERMKKGIPPATAEEYLLRVRLEGEQIPKVVVAEELAARNETRKYVQKEDVVVEERHDVNRIDIGWSRSCTLIFNQARTYLSRMDCSSGTDSKTLCRVPGANNPELWHHFCFGRFTNGSTLEHKEAGTPPLLGVVSQLTAGNALTLLRYHLGWLEWAKLSRSRACWIYALLLRVEKPLNDTSGPLLRDLEAKFRSLEQQALQESDEPTLQNARVLLVVTTSYFGQR